MKNVLIFEDFFVACNKALFSKCLFSLILLLNFTVLSSQNWGTGWVYVENVQTGLLIDVQGNVKANGTTVWPYSLNYSKAQMFRFSSAAVPSRFGSDARYILAYDNSSLSTEFYFSVKQPQMVISPDNLFPGTGIGSTGTINPTLSDQPQLVDAGIGGIKREFLNNYIFTIDAKVEYEASSIGSPISLGTEPMQIWKIIPVPNEPDVYYIQNAHLSKNYVIEPLDFSSGGSLVLGAFNGSNIQKWRILTTKPNEPVDLKLTNLKWERDLNQSTWKFWKWHYEYKVKGDLSWNKNNSTEDLLNQQIIVEVDNEYDYIIVPANKSSSKFSVKSKKSSETKEHCVDIRVYSKWKAENMASSDEVCGIPDSPDQPQTPTQPGVSKLFISNCHSSKTDPVRLWLYDLTSNNGNWQDKGTLNNQWNNNNCPSGSPKEILITNDHEYILKAIDCSNQSPDNTNGSCHVLTSARFKGAGNSNGTTLIFQISGG